MGGSPARERSPTPRAASQPSRFDGALALPHIEPDAAFVYAQSSDASTEGDLGAFHRVSRAIQDDYNRLQDLARRDPQRAGHGAETAWVDVLRTWLPSTYGVETRKYVVPELKGAPEPTETDIVIFGPGTPEALRRGVEILPGAVAALISVKLTLNRDGIKDAVQRAAALRAGLYPRSEDLRSELVPPFPYILLCHDHSWRSGRARTWRTVQMAVDQFSDDVAHPRHLLDGVCIPSLGTWWTYRTSSRRHLEIREGTTPPELLLDRQEDYAITSFSGPYEEATEERGGPVGDLVCRLLIRLSYVDPTLRPLVDHLGAVRALLPTRGLQRKWPVEDVYSDRVRRLMEKAGPWQEAHRGWDVSYR